MERLNTSVESESSKIMRNKHETSEACTHIQKQGETQLMVKCSIVNLCIYSRYMEHILYMDVSKNRGTPQMDGL